MAEGTEKSIRERIEETRMKQAIKIQEETVSSSIVWDCHRAEHDGITEENIKEHVEECLGEMLNNYIEDERNYALDGAVISCDQMSDKEVFIQFTENGSKIRLEGSVGTITSEYTKPAGIGPERYNPEFEEWVIDSHVGEENIRKLHAVSGNSQTDNGIRFATVIDRSYLREEEEKFGPKSDKYSKSKKKEIKFVDARVKNECAADKENPVSIVSCGNCKKLEEKDIKKIAENWDGVCKYGTCYALMQLASNWINPYCMESITGECKGEDFLSPFSGFDAASHTLEYATCVIEHHRPIKFSTTEGEKEGLTMMSTLLCGKEGIITIEASRQIYVEPKAESINTEIVQGVSDELIILLKSYETGADINGKLLTEGEPALQTYHGASDVANVNTIGWGHAMSSEEEGCITFADGTTKELYQIGSTITYAEAEELLNRDIEEREAKINQQLKDRGIEEKVNQQFYDALFLLEFQIGEQIFVHADFSGFLNEGNFELSNKEEIILQFCEYSNGRDDGTMKRRADELDIIFNGDYERNDNVSDINRYASEEGNIWGELSERKNREKS